MALPQDKISAALMAKPPASASQQPQAEPDADDGQQQQGDGLDQIEGLLAKMPSQALAGIIVQLASSDPKILQMLEQMIGGAD